MPFRVAAISFLNPAPLLFHFDHEPEATELRSRYQVHSTTPSRCAAQLHAGEADLGLIPVAELTPDLLVVPGCVIASQDEVRSILLLVRSRGTSSTAEALHRLRTLAVDHASRSSTAYVRSLLRGFYSADPAIMERAADPLAMLEGHDAALLIGDPALLARERREAVDHAFEAAYPGEHLLWLDVARLWRQHTALPWVAAVWAVRPAALARLAGGAQTLIHDLQQSRDAGLTHTEQLVAEWTPRLPLRPATIRTYLTQNIHYVLDDACLNAIRAFRQLAADTGVLSPLPELHLLQPNASGVRL